MERNRKVEPGQSLGHTLHGVVIVGYVGKADWSVGWILILFVAVESFRYY